MAVSRIDEAGLNVTQYGNRNLIINGAMEVWQRGTSFSSGGYHADRFSVDAANASNFSYSQSTDTPAGFKYSTKIQTTTAFTATSYQFYRYNIEGQDLVQLQLGSSGAEKITLSFWVRASQTGNYSIAFTNSANNYAYPTTYTIDAADTWEHKTVTLDGPTAGTWLTTNAVGLRIKWDLGSGGTFDSTTDAWVAADKATVSGSVKLGATLNANLYLTGVQLEVGDTATPFEHRSYADELQRCQRYFCHSNVGEAANEPIGEFIAMAENTTRMDTAWTFRVIMRDTPTITKLSDYIIRTNNNQTITSASFDSTNKGNTWILSTGSFTDKEAGRVYTSAAGAAFSADAEL